MPGNPHPIDNGMTSKPGPGRPKGSKNRVVNELREYVKELVAGELPFVAESLAKVREKNPIEYTKLVTRLFELVVPKMQEVEVKTTDTIDVEATLKNLQDKIE